MDKPQPGVTPADLQVRTVDDMRASVGVPARPLDTKFAPSFVPAPAADIEVAVVPLDPPSAAAVALNLDVSGAGSILDAIRANRGKA